MLEHGMDGRPYVGIDASEVFAPFDKAHTGQGACGLHIYLEWEIAWPQVHNIVQSPGISGTNRFPTRHLRIEHAAGHNAAGDSGMEQDGGSSRDDAPKDRGFAEFAAPTVHADLMRDPHNFKEGSIDEVPRIGTPESSRPLHGLRPGHHSA